MRKRLPQPKARIDTCTPERPKRRPGSVPAALAAAGIRLVTAAPSAAVSRNSRRVRGFAIAAASVLLRMILLAALSGKSVDAPPLAGLIAMTRGCDRADERVGREGFGDEA